MSGTLAITLWNVAWATPASPRGEFFRQHFTAAQSDVIAVTEGFAELLPADGHVIMSDADYGYPIHEGRRKVLLWSRRPWRDVDVAANSLIPSGRLIAGTTATPVGDVHCFGVCIPWRDAHVRTGRRDRAPWEDHLAFLEHLNPLLRRRRDGLASLILGDFNQRVPRARQPLRAFETLMETLGSDFKLVTDGPIAGTTELTIDHLAVTRDFEPRGIEHLSRYDLWGAEMSDHFGLRARLQLR